MWAQNIAAPVFPVLIELAPKSASIGFLLPAAEIHSVGEAVYAGVATLARLVASGEVSSEHSVNIQ